MRTTITSAINCSDSLSNPKKIDLTRQKIKFKTWRIFRTPKSDG
jgi:hypothetical protein